jgi:hypothetical protein
MKAEPIKAWQQPCKWKPKCPCDKCDGSGMGSNKRYANNGEELIDWDDCDKCGGTGETPKEKA